ncbi:hypothetical protein PENFLA_c095G07633 [Penicillium flavigenum]|uniref:AMP-dependent synthetase/ligase domain-containing protein n=1 Tax=Penicillium flavigenum TaxID=254877 RepID=A0A1V6S8L8_9EURO|nr:hypothetical protein PENFLA_c095G07633 [Penicillium flavigenum]
MERIQSKVPSEPFLLQLFERWQQSPDAVVIKDAAEGTQATGTTFLHDILIQKDYIYNRLDEDAKKRLSSPDENDNVFIGLLAAAGYHYAVLFFAIYSLGAVAVPLLPRVLPEEAKYFLSVCNASLLASSPTATDHAQSISTVTSTPTYTYTPPTTCQPAFTLSSNTQECNPEKGFVLLYTSGTTGPPKGVLYSRRSAAIGLRTKAEQLGLTPNDLWLHHMPAHWGAGFDFFTTCVYAGTCVEFCNAVYTSDWFWGRIKKGDVTCMFASPSVLDGLLESLGKRSGEEYEAGVEGLRGLKLLASGAMRVSDRAKAVWRELRGDRPLVVLYSATEVAGLISTTHWEDGEDVPVDCCGTPPSNLEVKLSEEGEICIRGPQIMKRYLSSDPNVMNNIYDSEGFYKTGDVGRLENNRVFVLGRASHDVIRFQGWKIYAPEIEDALHKHPEVLHVLVVGVRDPKLDQLVAALLVVKDGVDINSERLKITNLRRWLALEQGVPRYKLPTMLRCVTRNPDPLPRTGSGKPIKPKIREILFAEAERENGNVQAWNLATEEPEIGRRAWDWAGGAAR